MPRARVPPIPPRPQGKPNKPIEQSGWPWTKEEASHRAWHAAAEAVHYEDDDGSSKARRADRAEAKVAAAAAEAEAKVEEGKEEQEAGGGANHKCARWRLEKEASTISAEEWRGGGHRGGSLASGHRGCSLGVTWPCGAL